MPLSSFQKYHSQFIFKKNVTPPPYCGTTLRRMAKTEKVASTPLTLTAYPTAGRGGIPNFFMKMTARDIKEITYMPLVTFFSVLERPGKTVRGVATTSLG